MLKKIQDLFDKLYSEITQDLLYENKSIISFGDGGDHDLIDRRYKNSRVPRPKLRPLICIKPFTLSEELELPLWGFIITYDVETVYLAPPHLAFPLVREYPYIWCPGLCGHPQEHSAQTGEQLREPGRPL
jgi:hypothetical protein